MFSKQQERTNKLRKLVDSWRFQRIILINLRQGKGGSARMRRSRHPTLVTSTLAHRTLQKLMQLGHYMAPVPINHHFTLLRS